MLTTSEIQAELAKVSYRPGWRFTVYDGDWEGQHIVVTTVVEDAYNPGQTTCLDVHTTLPPIPDVNYLHRWIMHRLYRIEIHEMREWYRVDGRLVSDPHGENSNRDSDTYQPG